MMILANDPAAAEGERDNALRMAHATLAKYNLTMAEAESVGTQREEERLRDGTLATRHKWSVRCAQAVATLFFCEYFYTPIDRGTKMKHSFIGRASNVVTAKMMTEFVIKSIVREANTRSKDQFSPGAFQRNFAKGATQRIVERCRELRRAAEAPQPSASTGTAIVLASFYRTEAEANAQWIAAQGYRIMVDHDREHAAGAGYHEGKTYGDRISLSKQLGDNS